MKDLDLVLRTRGHKLMTQLPQNDDGEFAPHVYVCMPFIPGKNGLAYARSCAQKVIDEGGVPVCPFQMYQPLFPEVCRPMVNAVKLMALSLLTSCDEVWVFGTSLNGFMMDEISMATTLDIPVVYLEREGNFNDNDEEEKPDE